MTLLPPSTESVPSDVYVALDLETTGLELDRDEIIEVGAVKFQGPTVLESYATLVNPFRPIPEFIRRLTGITQRDVEGAPPFSVVAGELRDFVGALPVVGHNIPFDLGFLASHGLRLHGPAYDTWDLAFVLLPGALGYSLAQLTSLLGVPLVRHHRALDDAEATRLVFLTLLERAQGLGVGVLAQLVALARRARWPAGDLLGSLEASRRKEDARAQVGPLGVDLEALRERLGPGLAAVRVLTPQQKRGPLDEEALAATLAPGGLLARSLPGYEYRPQQVEMLRGVVKAFNQGTHLMVEGGTGIGKSLAYLLPAILFSARNGTQVVISTNTINLQEQLIQKDIPAVVQALEEGDLLPRGQLRGVQLKGRANYLCLRRWAHLARSETLSPSEARLVGKTLVWLQGTATGDRAELNLSGRDGYLWGHISAGERGHCPGSQEGLCFLRSAREAAEGAHIVVVNHALLLSDLAMGGGLLPPHDHLIIDEAHHLEEEATRQLGFQVSQGTLEEELERLGRSLDDVRLLLRSLAPHPVLRQEGEQHLAELEAWLPRARENWARLWALAAEFLREHHEGSSEYRPQLRVTSSTRAQPAWPDLEVDWENLDLVLAEGIRQVERLLRLVDTLPPEGPLDAETILLALASWVEDTEELRARLKGFLANPERETICWMAQEDQEGTLSFHSAPLNVGPELQKRLFEKRECVILTSATLSTTEGFGHIRERIGLAEAEELLVGSPFDYRQAALLFIANDMPTPNAAGYTPALGEALTSLAEALEGRTMALFTSYAALKWVRTAILPSLESQGIRVLAQGIDGSPRQLVEAFSEDPKTVLLGTSSFWEGVDLSGGILKALVLARLPFNVPTDPVFAARSQLYEDPFSQYGVPQAVLRFRQGFGRLIRGKGDRGVIVVLDSRVLTRPYGSAFLDAVPPCTVRTAPLGTLPAEARAWVQR
ncbi:MAG: helicase C-terminal domain-containing protein [Dehalococcoidia bacterium]